MTERHDNYDPDRDALRPAPLDQTGAGRQPANPKDLEAFPPQDEVCIEVRGLLRDFVDGDLPGGEHTRVERHVHECRSCSLALSRAESEVMLIQSALEEIDPKVLRAPAGFGRGVMRQVHEAAVGEPTIGFTQRVMHRVLEESMEDRVDAERADRDRRGSRVSVYLLAAAAVLLSTLVFVIQGGGSDVVATEVLAARDAELIRDGERIALTNTRKFAPGEFGPKDRFVTGEAGSLELAFKAPAGARRADGKPAADLLVTAFESTSLQVDAADEASPPVIALGSGEVQVGSDRGVTVALRDGSAVQLHGGSIAVAVESVRDVASRAVLRVTVLVDAGSATVSRGGEAVAVTAGNEASYTTFSAVAVGPAPERSLFIGSRRRAAAMAARPAVVDPGQQDHFGQVLDPRNGAPVPNVSVSVVTYLGTQTLRTDAHGMFGLADQDLLAGQFGLVRALPPAGVPGLAASAVTPLRVDPGAGPHRLHLRRSQVLRGRIHDESNRPIPGLWLQAGLVDEFCGVVLPLGRTLQIGARGAFQFENLPAEVASHERLVLVAGAKGEVHPQVVWTRAAVGSEDASVDLRVRRRQPVPLGGFTPGAGVEVLQAVHGLPLTNAHLRRHLVANAQGEISLDAAVTSYLLRADGAPQRLVPRGGQAQRLDEPLAFAVQDLRAGTLPVGRIHWIRQSSVRVAEMPERNAGAWRHGLSVHETESAQACPGTQLYLRPRGQDAVVFLGVFNGRAPLACSSDTAGRVLARTPEGWLGGVEFDGATSRPQVSVPVQRSGRIAWKGAPDGVVVLERIDHRGVAVPMARMASQELWTLPTGTYRYAGRRFRLDADAVVTLE